MMVWEKTDLKVSSVKRGRCEYHQGNGVGGEWNSCSGLLFFLLFFSLLTVSTLLEEESQNMPEKKR